MPRFLIAVVLSLGLAGWAEAATITAASCSTANVQTAVNTALDGDTVVIPDGSCVWSSGITSTKQIVLTGATVPTRTATATDGTTITHQAGAATLLTFTIGGSFHTTVANLRFRAGTGTGNYLGMGGTGIPPLLHDAYFEVPNFQLFQPVQWFVTGGVIWNVTFESLTNPSGICGSQVGSDSGSLAIKGNRAWDTNSTMGMLDVNGDQNTYIENSTFINVGQAPDVDENGRAVIRYNTYIDSWGLLHGVTGPNGGRHTEIYNNTYQRVNPNRPMNVYYWYRGGTGVITNNAVQANNSVTCYPNKADFQFTVESATRSSTHGCCTGYQCWHQPGTGADQACNFNNLSPSQSPPDPCQISDPVYVWNNTGTGATGYPNYIVLSDSDFSCNTGFTTASFFIQNRDYFVDSGPKPGWVPYTYPHPLTSGTTPVLQLQGGALQLCGSALCLR